MLDKVKQLFASEESVYSISKKSGVPLNTARRLKIGEAKLENATYKNIKLLHDYQIKKEMGEMRVWEREGYRVEEKEFDFDLHEFDVISFKSVNNEKVVATITPTDLDMQQQIIEDLDNGEDVGGWEDGMGNTISI